MKKLYTLLLFLVSLAAHSQSIDNQWHQYIEKPEVLRRDDDSKVSYFLIRTDNMSTMQQSSSMVVVRILDRQHCIVRIDPDLLSQSKFAHITDYESTNDLWKLSPNLSMDDAELTTSQHFIVKALDFKACKEIIEKSNSAVLIQEYAHSNTLEIRASPQWVLHTLLQSPNIIYISSPANSPTEESLVLDMNLNVNRITYVHHNQPDLNGAGQTLSIKEQKFNPDDPDFAGRIVPSSISSADISKHATEMATIAGGAGNSSPTSKGVAWGANLSSTDFMNLFPDNIDYFTANNIQVQNHAYGTIIENFYGAYAEAYDQQTHANPTLLHVFSIGNNGRGVDSTGTYKGVQGYANLTGNFKMAKNIITVAAIDTLYNYDQFVSKGPAYDGRVKPELSAYSVVGSSSSAALVSGAGILLQHAYQQKHTSPANATLLKGILMNSADDVGPTGIDFATGYGSLNVKKALETLDQENYRADQIGNAELKTYSIDVPANARNLKVMLIWNDPAASVNAGYALVNDLGLEVKHVGTGESWLPWVLNSYPHPDSLSQLPQRKEDHLNTIEQVTVAAPQAGTYDLYVLGDNIPSGPQDFYLVYTWEDMGQFTWTYPTGSDNLPYNGETVSFFRWESTFANEKGKLEYSTDGGSNWIGIDEEVDLSKEYYSWTPPQIYSTALARMVINGSVYTSDEFTISYPLKARVGFNCPDSVMLNWPRVENALTYKVYTLGDKYLSTIANIADTSLILYKREYSQLDYAVAPVFENGKTGIRNLTFNYIFQGVDCYLSGFFALEDQQLGHVNISLTLGTVYKVSQIIFERSDADGNFSTISTVVNPSSNRIEIRDQDPMEGLNFYRARILFDNDTAIETQTVSVYFLFDRPALIFPNPIEQGSDELFIFTRYLGSEPAVFKLMNDKGQEVLNMPLISERESVSISRYAKGLYLYTITGSGFKESGKIIIR